MWKDSKRNLIHPLIQPNKEGKTNGVRKQKKREEQNKMRKIEGKRDKKSPKAID